MTTITEDEVEKHNTESDCWIVITDKTGPKVYDVTKYLDDHPGGKEIMLEVAGKDATGMFEDVGHSSEARTTMKKYLKGDLYEDPDKPRKKVSAAASLEKSGGGLNPFAILAMLIAIALGIWYSNK